MIHVWIPWKTGPFRLVSPCYLQGIPKPQFGQITDPILTFALSTWASLLRERQAPNFINNDKAILTSILACYLHYFLIIELILYLYTSAVSMAYHQYFLLCPNKHRNRSTTFYINCNLKLILFHVFLLIFLLLCLYPAQLLQTTEGDWSIYCIAGQILSTNW